MTRLRTLVNRIDALLSSSAEENEITQSSIHQSPSSTADNQTTESVVLQVPYYPNTYAWHTYRSLERETGATDLSTTRKMTVQVSYIKNDASRHMEVTQIQFPNSKISTRKNEQSDANKMMWYDSWKKSKNLVVAYNSPDTFDITPALHEYDHDYIIHFTPPLSAAIHMPHSAPPYRMPTGS